MSDIVERLCDPCVDYDGTNMPHGAEALSMDCGTLREAADEIQSLRQRVERLEGGLSDLIQSCSRTAVGSGDGGTFVVGPPEHGALTKASALLQERQ